MASASIGDEMLDHDKLKQVQVALKQASLDGWLMYDFRRNNELACDFLDISPLVHLTRRFFYWIPASGEPIKICHVIEQQPLKQLPGHLLVYRSWNELEAHVGKVLEGSERIAMEYSPNNAIPYVSKVDGGTLEMVRNWGAVVVSSADLLQAVSGVWTPEQFEMHLFAANVVDTAAERAWQWISLALQQQQTITDYDVQQYLLNEFMQNHCTTDCPPICALNADSANPHFSPEQARAKKIEAGDLILIDLTCKQDAPQAVYADITRVAIAASVPTMRQQVIFGIVQKARDAATEFIRHRISSQQPVHGYEVDQVARDIITQEGYGDNFLHRTGHSIGTSVHGYGANIDNLETQDRRALLKGTCFSIEPGIYLPGEFGIRLEYDVCIQLNGEVVVTGGIQNHLRTLM